jgi:hypothetical protein
MAMSKSFIERVRSISVKGEALAAVLHDVAQYAVKAAYSNADWEPANFVMTTIPQYMRAQTASWLRRAGLVVNKPEIGQKDYSVTGVLDQKRQAKAFEFIAGNPVLALEATEKREPKKKELKGTPQTRAADAVSKLITRLQDSDYETAALINDRWTSNSHKSVLFNADGKATYLDAEELELITTLLIKREVALRQAA